MCGGAGTNRTITFHHYNPKPYRGNGNDGLRIHKIFHDWLHQNYTNKELSELYGNLDGILELYELYR